MKEKSNLKTILVILQFIFLFLPLDTIKAENGEDFGYSGIWYTIISEEDGTCKTREGSLDSYPWEPGNPYCSQEIDIPSVAIYNRKEYKVVEIGDASFCNCDYLNSVTFPETLVSIGDYAFYRCI